MTRCEAALPHEPLPSSFLSRRFRSISGKSRRSSPSCSIRSKAVAEIEAACRKARTAFFFKQWGGVRKKSTGRHYRGRTFDEMPRAAAMS